MHHVRVDRWSRGESPLHARDPRAKLLALFAFLVVLATTPGDAWVTFAIDAAMVLSGILIGGLPLLGLLIRAMVVLPFAITFGLITWFSGDHLRAQALVEKSFLSTLAVLLLVGSTPLPMLLNGLERLGTPRLLVLVAQFLYRYLFVISEQAQHLMVAATCRRGSSRRGFTFTAAGGALAVLFARSYYRAEGIHRALLSRAFNGQFSLLTPLRFRPMDGIFAASVTAFLILARIQ